MRRIILSISSTFNATTKTPQHTEMFSFHILRGCLNLLEKLIVHDSDESELVHSHGTIGVELVVLG